MSTGTLTPVEVVYPDDDGEPMSDNTVQARWIVTVFGNLAGLFRGDLDVFVAMNHLIYPIEGDLATRAAPDAYVAFGRPKGDRGSYQVWNEGGVFPQVVFEVLSPSNYEPEMDTKRDFYERHGAEEYYVIDPARDAVRAYLAGPGGRFAEVPPAGLTSPRLGVGFRRGPDGWVLVMPDGRPFRTFEEVVADDERRAAENAGLTAENAGLAAENAGLMTRIEAERQWAEAAHVAAEERAAREAANARAARLRELLKAAGLDPEGVS